MDELLLWDIKLQDCGNWKFPCPKAIDTAVLPTCFEVSHDDFANSAVEVYMHFFLCGHLTLATLCVESWP